MRGEIERQPGGERPSATRLGPVEIIPCARTLRIDGRDASIGGRAFDLLLVLLEARGEIVPKEEIMRRVWPSVTVIESNLKVQISLLRRALGPERWRVKTVSGRGCLLVTDAPAPAARRGARGSAGQPLVIVVETDPSARDSVMRAMSELAVSCAGVTRLSLL